MSTAAKHGSPASTPDPDEALTIDALAQRAGTTTRNVRSLQTRGLLPPPVMVGRVGHYGAEHLERLHLVGRLQERGYSLAAIDDLLQAWSERRSVGDLLGFERAIDRADGTTESEVELGIEELIARFPEIDLTIVQRAIELEVVIPVSLDPPTFRVPSLRLLDIGRALVDIGVPLPVIFDQLGVLREGTAQMAKVLVAMFAEHVIAPWAAEGHPVEDVPDLLDRVRRTKPLPLAALSALMNQALEREVAAALSRIVPKRRTPSR